MWPQGLDTTFYLHDYENWTNSQLQQAIGQKNYKLTVESWLEQRSYIANAISNLNSNVEINPGHAAFKAEITKALLDLEPQAARRTRQDRLRALHSVPVRQASQATFQCKPHRISLRFATDGSIAMLQMYNGSHTVKLANGAYGKIGRVRYQTLSSDNFTEFNRLYTGHCLTKNQSALETPACHNFHKPNMSSAYGGDTSAGYGVFSPRMANLWRSDDSCVFVTESLFVPRLWRQNGAPRKIISSFAIGVNGLEINVTAINKTSSRLAESLWVSFESSKEAAPDGSAWRLRYFANTSYVSEVDPSDTVEHGAIHLHALGADGEVVYGDDKLRFVSLDVPIVSAGLLSPFPTMLSNVSGEKFVARDWIQNYGWHYNWQNQIWNTNFPQVRAIYFCL